MKTKLNLTLAKHLQRNRYKINFATKYGSVEPIAIKIHTNKRNTKYWYKGSTTYAIFPPIEYNDQGILLDHYFIKIAFSPKAPQYNKKTDEFTYSPEAMAFYCNSKGYVDKEKMEDDEIRNTRTLLKTFPKTEEEFLKITSNILNKIYPNINIQN